MQWISSLLLLFVRIRCRYAATLKATTHTRGCSNRRGIRVAQFLPEVFNLFLAEKQKQKQKAKGLPGFWDRRSVPVSGFGLQEAAVDESADQACCPWLGLTGPPANRLGLMVEPVGRPLVAGKWEPRNTSNQSKSPLGGKLIPKS